MSLLISPVTDFRSSPLGNRKYIVIKYWRLFSLWSYLSQILISAFSGKTWIINLLLAALTWHFIVVYTRITIRCWALGCIGFLGLLLTECASKSQQKGTRLKYWKEAVNPAGQMYPTEREMYCHKEIKDAHNLLSAARYTHHGLLL